MKKYLSFIAVIFLTGFLFTACEKEDINQTAEEDITSSEDLTTVQNLFQDTEDEFEFQLETRDENNECPAINISPEDGSFPRTVTIDYGTEGCEGRNGRIRRGVIRIDQTAELREEGATRTVTFADFFVDGAQIRGIKTFANEGPDQDGNPTFTRTIEDASITFPDGRTANWEASHTLTQTAGADTPRMFDNVFEVTGSSSGVNRNGTAYSSVITEALIKEKSCPWIVSGVREVTVGERTRTISYGDGSCDRRAEVTLANGRTRTIRIRPWWR